MTGWGRIVALQLILSTSKLTCEESMATLAADEGQGVSAGHEMVLKHFGSESTALIKADSDGEVRLKICGGE